MPKLEEIRCPICKSPIYVDSVREYGYSGNWSQVYWRFTCHGCWLFKKDILQSYDYEFAIKLLADSIKNAEKIREENEKNEHCGSG